MSLKMQRDAQVYARALLDSQGLTSWRFGFNRRRRAAGLCSYRHRTVFISIYHLADEWTRIKDTIAHEVAHALTPGHNHDHVWKAKARELGCTGDRCYILGSGKMESVRYAYKVICPKCGPRGLAHKAPRRHGKSCGICSQGTYNPAYELAYVPNYENLTPADMPKVDEEKLRQAKRARRAARRARRQQRLRLFDFSY